MCDRHRLWSGLLAAIGLWTGVSHALAGPFVEHLSPPSLSRGKTSRVTLVGSELQRRDGFVDVAGREGGRGVRSSSRAGTTWPPSTVKVDRDAPLGIYGLRLATRSGLSNVKLFLIDDLPDGCGTGIEPSDRGAPAPELARGRTGEGRARPTLTGTPSKW